MILVTGGAGYIGSHTVLNFLKKNHEIVIFDSLENGFIEIVKNLQKEGKVHFVKGDLKNPEDIKKLFDEYDIDFVLHFAAYSLVEESVKNPAKYYRNNVLGTLNLLDEMIKNDVKKIVFSSTCATYGEPKYIPIDEEHPQIPINPYGVTKLIIEKILQDYDRAYGLKSIILRYFNVAGCDEKRRSAELHNPETHLIPNILKSANDSSQVFHIFGTDYDTKDGTCIRDYVNVEDLAEAHRLAFEYLDRENRSDIFNIGSENGYSVKEVFDTCEKVLGQKINTEFSGRRSGDCAVLLANSKKVQTVLGWKPTRTLENSIETAYNAIKNGII